MEDRIPTYPRGNYTVIDEEIILPNYQITDAYDKILNGFKQGNKYKQGQITEIRFQEEPTYLKICAYNDSPTFSSSRMNEKDIVISLEQKKDNVIVHIKIDSHIAKSRKKRIITDQELHWPKIVEAISLDLLGYVDPVLYDRLFPKKHREIMNFENKLLYLIGGFWLIFLLIDFRGFANQLFVIGFVIGIPLLYKYIKRKFQGD